MNQFLTSLLLVLQVAFLIACHSQEGKNVSQKDEPSLTMPQALRKGIAVEAYCKVERGAIRLNFDSVSGDFFYNTMRGDIYRIDTQSDSLAQTLEYTVEDHGITSLQGFRLYNDLMFLVGNVESNEGKGTKGKIVRGKRNIEGKFEFELLAITEDYGRTGTLYSHEFNGIAIDHAGEFIYVNSGARTDHGELQENGGAYPGAREVPLTACVFRLPVGGNGILLKNDLNYLKENGYLFADGIRNAYDLAVAPNGHLFAVSNSSDYDHAEEMNWLREGLHYGYPWEMGNTENPQQFADWQPDPDKDPFINTKAFAYNNGQFANDPGFPNPPEGVSFMPPIQNEGPDANMYRDRQTGLIMDGDSTGQTVGTFTPHRSPLGLFFDNAYDLPGELKGGAFVLSWSNGDTQPLMKPFSHLGGDLMYLKLRYDQEIDNYRLNAYRIIDGFRGPTDAVQVRRDIYIIENRGFVWKVSFDNKDQS
jgi:hypothetical protein